MSYPDPEQARWFAEEVQPHEPALRAYLRARFRSLPDVDDLVQESYLRVLRARGSGAIRSARAFLFQTARNAALDLVRKHRTVSLEALGTSDCPSVLHDGPTAADAAGKEQELALLREAIQALPPRCREVMVLQRIDGLSYHEIAARLGISEHTVSAQLTAGLLRCRDYLRQRGLLKEASRG